MSEVELNRFPIGGIPSYQETIINDFYKKAWREFDQRLSDYVRKNLADLGYIFNSVEEYHDFIRRRVSRVSFEDNRDYFEFYLDCVDEDNPGTFIGSYSHNVEVNMDGDKITASFGKNIPGKK